MMVDIEHSSKATHNNFSIASFNNYNTSAVLQ